ncbi:MAG: prolyl oligopeptidase family serine peptidase [Clostridia bacterium]|nr:prolyl oligopeptidase family serine peptidase [Clostridia bacterium]
MKIRIDQFVDFKYIIRYPDCYKEGEKFPVIILLHGAGSRGNDIDVLTNNPYFSIVNRHSDFPFITVAPQCSENTWFDMFELLKRFVYKIADENFADKNRIYLMGASMGGYGTWQLAMSLPELFAAIVPICGGGMYWNAPRLVNVPIWAFHGEKDTVVHKEESIKMVDAVNRCGGSAKLTIYPENEHDAWSDTYNNPEVFRWLLSNVNKNSVKLIDKYNDSDIYG